MTPFAQYVENTVANRSADALTATAAGSLLSSLRTNGYADVTTDSLQMWVVDMATANLQPTTRKKYLGRMATLYRAWKHIAGENPFDAVKDAVETEFQFDAPQARANLERMGQLINHPAPSEVAAPYRNLFLYLFYNPTATLADALRLRFDSSDAISCPQIDNILDQQREAASARTTAVFPLGQGRKREPQLLREALAELGVVASLAGMTHNGDFSRRTITATWIAAALKAGVTVADIRSMVHTVPDEYPSLRLVPVRELSEQRKTDILRRVADAVNNHPRQWFVMKMRTGHTPATIRERISNAAPELLPDIQFYYPTHKVMRRNAQGRHMKTEVPYLRGILFFQMDRTRVATLMSRIGDAAWCYKQTNTPASPYCTISRNEMTAFQRSIGTFTPDIEMELELRATPLHPGTTVKIAGGGPLTGEHAIIESVRNINGTRTYTLSLTAYLQARWTIKDLPEVYLDPLPTA